jgi:hypothetical protein
MKPRRIIISAASSLLGMASSAIAAAGGREDTTDLVIWGFLGFCALIVVGQLIPVIFTLWGAKKAFERSPAEAPVLRGAEEEPKIVFEEE